MPGQANAAPGEEPKVGLVRDQYLDVLRGFAILLVVLRHAWPNAFPGAGIVGVTLFFALSGYLITRVLDRDLQSLGRPRFRRFYLHRALRLYFALALVTAVAVVVTLVLTPSIPVRHLLGVAGSALLYLSDIPKFFISAVPLSHLWTLSVEEQFYLLWPLILWCAIRFTRKLGAVALGWAILLTAACVISALRATQPAAIYMLPTTWASTIAIGGAAYFYRDAVRRMIGRTAPLFAALAVAVLIAVSFYPDAKDQTITYLVGPTLIAVCAALIINWATAPGNELVAFRPARPLLWLGRISYAVYLWNLPVTVWWNDAIPHQQSWMELALIPLTLAPAIVSWYTVEALGRYLRRRFDARASGPGGVISSGPVSPQPAPQSEPR